ncbi:uncharacterized protein LOC105190181 [Harpegnathos saltator]|uniref:Pre-rRNA-processing protein TSR2 homolog n=1 Tax=Harpegnathos saltator TaxID=610380 RepID=E2C5I7_HARSA|nr:uncharacterized protein LOC105190181 [Harpegnathos saltator]EFN76800.1 hypothetical protein EAI_16444 [Harpegnathos saltator]
MADTQKFFLTITQRIFSNWTALKLAVEHGMCSKDNAVEFCTYVTDVLYLNDGLDVSKVAAILEDYMDDCFSTEIEDDSAREVADILLQFYRYCIEGNESTARTEFEKLPPLQSWLLLPQPVQHSHVTTNYDNKSSSDEDMDSNNENTNEEGWMTVKSGRRRR